MFSFRTTSLLEQEDHVLHSGRVGVLCDETAWEPSGGGGEYLAEALSKRNPHVKRILTEVAEAHNSLIIRELEGLDALVFEMQDAGCRYYKCPNLIFKLFKTLTDNNLELPIYLVDRINPAGRRVEGTPLTAGYRSAIGIEGLPHRYGLTIGELAYYLYNKSGAKFPLHIISYKASSINKELLPWSIPLSANFAGMFSATFYPGGALWGGTNVSFGEGTPRPFEVVGAPFMKFTAQGGTAQVPEDEGVYMRRAVFTPAYGLYRGQACYGWQLLQKPGVEYNSVAHTLRMMRFVKRRCPEFDSGTVDERLGERESLELLLGDKVLLDYVRAADNGRGADSCGGGEEDIDYEAIKEHIKLEEQKWIKKTKKFLLYDEQLYRAK